MLLVVLTFALKVEVIFLKFFNTNYGNVIFTFSICSLDKNVGILGNANQNIMRFRQKKNAVIFFFFKKKFFLQTSSIFSVLNSYNSKKIEKCMFMDVSLIFTKISVYLVIDKVFINITLT